MTLPATDLAEARTLFTGAGLPFPYVPPEMEVGFRKRDRWCYATREIVESPYLIDWYASEARASVPDYMLLAHAGHGINSYAIHYFVVRGSLALFIQAPWGGVYMQEEECVATMREYFDLAETILKAGEAFPGRPTSDRLVIFVSDFYGSWWTEPGVTAQPRNGPLGAGRDVLHAALAWIRGRR